MAKRSPPLVTISAGMIASVSGILILSGRALPRSALDVDRAADLLDVGSDHIHADAAAGDVGHLLRGREARAEDRGSNASRVGHAGGLVGGDQPALDRLALDPLGSMPAAVVGDLDVDLSAFVKGAQGKPALRRLARGDADIAAARCRDRPRCGRCGSADP